MTNAIAQTPSRTTEPARFAGLDPLEFAAKGFLASYRSRTLEGYTLDLKSFFAWCADRDLPPLQALRPHLELFIRWMQDDAGYATATVNRRWNTIALFYRWATDEDVIVKDPAARIKRPRIDRDGQRRTHLTPLEHGLFLAAAAQMGPTTNALATLLGMRGLRIAEACSLDVDDVVQIGGYDHVKFVGKGGESACIPLPVPCMRAVRTAIGQRTAGPLLVNARGRRLDRTSANRIVRKIACAAKVNTDISPHSLRRSFVTTQLAIGVPLRDVQLSVRHKSPTTTAIYDRRSANPDSDTAHRVAGYLAGLGG